MSVSGPSGVALSCSLALLCYQKEYSRVPMCINTCSRYIGSLLAIAIVLRRSHRRELANSCARTNRRFTKAEFLSESPAGTYHIEWENIIVGVHRGRSLEQLRTERQEIHKSRKCRNLKPGRRQLSKLKRPLRNVNYFANHSGQIFHVLDAAIFHGKLQCLPLTTKIIESSLSTTTLSCAFAIWIQTAVYAAYRTTVLHCNCEAYDAEWKPDLIVRHKQVEVPDSCRLSRSLTTCMKLG